MRCKVQTYQGQISSDISKIIRCELVCLGRRSKERTFHRVAVSDIQLIIQHHTGSVFLVLVHSKMTIAIREISIFQGHQHRPHFPKVIPPYFVDIPILAASAIHEYISFARMPVKISIKCDVMHFGHHLNHQL